MSTIQNILKDARAHMDKAIESTKHEFASIRSGKATTNMLDTVRVEVYGTMMNLNQVATVGTPSLLAMSMATGVHWSCSAIPLFCSSM